MTSMISAMLIYATQKHDGQKDKGGAPYILHPITVALKIKERFIEDDDLFCIALGHDLIEDTNATYEELKQIGMSDRVIDGIKALTKIPGENYEDYKNKVKSNKDAIKVKMQDLSHNSELSRLSVITNKDIERNRKYAAFYDELAWALHERLRK